MISPDRLERYKDFVDPEQTGAPYDPRKGLDRLMGILSPDTKGIVLATMDRDWYGSNKQLQRRIFEWLGELGLPEIAWEITDDSSWGYLLRKNKSGEKVDGSLVELGAVLKKAEDPYQTLYMRSLAGEELAIPLVQRAVQFVSKARQYAEGQALQGKPHQKFDSMWRIIGAVSSSTNDRRPLGVWTIIDFLISNPGRHRVVDLDVTGVPNMRLGRLLNSLGESGVIDYGSPKKEVKGKNVRGWAVYQLADQETLEDLDDNQTFDEIRSRNPNFARRGLLKAILAYIRTNPTALYNNFDLSTYLNIGEHNISDCLSRLEQIGLLERPDPGFGNRKLTSASANDLTRLFYDLVCGPAKEVADTLSPLLLRPWNRDEVTLFLQNYKEERSHVGIQGGEEVREGLVNVLSRIPGVETPTKSSYIVALYNDSKRGERELTRHAIRSQLKILLDLGKVEEPRPGYFRIASQTEN